MEYRPYPSSEPTDLPHLSVPRPVSTADGGYDPDVLNSSSTRYPWSLRNSVLGAADGERPLDRRFNIIKASSHGGAVQEKPYTPLLLKLWDPIGAVHELNGYRNDVLGHVARYRKEQEHALSAKEYIDEIVVLQHNNAAVMADKFASSNRDALRGMVADGDEYVDQSLRGGEKAISSENRAAYLEFRDGKISWSEYLQRRTASISRHAGVSADNDYLNPNARRDEISRRFSAHDSLRVMDTPQAWTGQSRAVLESFQRDARDKWENKYKPLIDWVAHKQRKDLYEEMVSAAMALVVPRTRALKAWLSNPLFLIVLEDFDTKDIKSGVNYEVAISEAIVGLGADDVGREYLEEQSRNICVNDKRSILWRAIALNQDDACDELNAYLKAADENKGAVMGAVGAGWNVFTVAAGGLKKFIGYYKSYEDLKKDIYSDSFVGRALKNVGVDHFVVGTGDFLMKALRLDKGDKLLGEYMVQHVLSIRALMDPVESSNLITTEAAHLPAIRAYYSDRIRHYYANPSTRANANMLALADLEQHRGVDVMRERWKGLTQSSKSPIRLAALTTVLEIVNFTNLAFKSDKRAKDYVGLLSSGLSLVSYGVTVATKLNETLLSKDSMSFARIKTIGGLLGGLSSSLATLQDGVEFNEARRSGKVGMSIVLGLKLLLGTLVSAAQLLGVIVYSAPLLERVAGKGVATIWLSNARYGIEAATAVRTARAAGMAASSVTIRAGALTGVGRTVLFLAGWEVGLAVVALQGLVWVLSPNELEVWCERNYFGKVREKNMIGFGGSEPKYKTSEEQSKAFGAAVVDVKIVHVGGVE